MSEDRRRWALVVGISLVSAGGILAAWKLHLGWQAFAVLVGLQLLAVTAYLALTRDRLLGALFVFGAAAGFANLVTNHWLITRAGSLCFPEGVPKLWSSAFYDPLTFPTMMVLLGWVATVLRRRWGVGIGTALAFCLGAVFLPVFESLCQLAGFWRWCGCSATVGNVPVWVILTEGLIVASLPLASSRLLGRPWTVVVAVGVGEAAWMGLATLVDYSMACGQHLSCQCP